MPDTTSLIDPATTYPEITYDAIMAIVGNGELSKSQRNTQVTALMEPLTTEADVIVSSVIIGFICSRYYQDQPCQFDYEHPNDKDVAILKKMDKDANYVPSNQEVAYLLNKSVDALTNLETADNAKKLTAKKAYDDYLKETQDFLTVLDAVSEVVSYQEPKMGEWLKDGQSPEGREGEVITGKGGGEMVDAKDRHTPMRTSKAKMLINGLNKKGTVYQGRGAYTGLVENPIEPNETLYPTMRVMPSATVRSWAGIDGSPNWGLIDAYNPNGSANLNPDNTIGMGPLPADNNHAQVGYVHGMCSAIVACKVEGPWCNAYEMATGEQTTKMASCFPCSTYMYASGFPASSIHLGRGESWLPPQSGSRLETTLGGNKETGCDDVLSKNLALNWHRTIFYQMKIGCKCLSENILRNNINVDHAGAILALDNKLDTIVDPNVINASGGTLFLNALSIHDKEVSRLKRTLKPIMDTMSFIVTDTLPQPDEE